MKRRTFLRNTALGATLPFWMQRCAPKFTASYPVDLHSDQKTGHLVFESADWPTGEKSYCDIAIVGGGLAGLSAAYQLKDQDFALFELSDRLGGTSASVGLGPLSLCQGAHYDLDYPLGYGEEVLKLLEELEVIRYQGWKKCWSFNDQQHIIPAQRRQQCYDHGSFREDVIPEGETKRRFLELLAPFGGKMSLPTRLISGDLQYLNDLSFLDFLSSHMEVSPEFERQLDYHMMDDYGGTTRQVSALAGIHYFMCRPYYVKPVSLFSPPQGNDYFVQRIAKPLPSSRLHKRHLVRRISEFQDGFELEVLDIAKRQVRIVKAGRVIYAGQKHALQYVFPSEHALFADNLYAPWLVLNFVTAREKGQYGFWQNEVLEKEKSFLGYIDSSVQDEQTLGDRRIFTAYYCLRPEDREYLDGISEQKDQIAVETWQRIQRTLQEKPKLDRAFVNIMGHAMPIPTKGYLFNDANQKDTSLIYAGVDNGRLPLLFEAVDSGLLAASLV